MMVDLFYGQVTYEDGNYYVEDQLEGGQRVFNTLQQVKEYLSEYLDNAEAIRERGGE